MSSSSKAKIKFYREGNIRLNLSNRNRLKIFLSSIFKSEKTPLASLSYIFCSDGYLLKLNQQYLQHNEFTDIITFDLSASKLTEGEIYISIDRVRENAQLVGASFKTELHRVIFHGALHLCGYKDKSARAARRMRAREDFYLKKYFRFT